MIPRSPGGEITPEGLWQWVVSRVNLISTPKSPAPTPGDVWRTERRSAGNLASADEAGFETGHAYAKALRMAKTWWVAPGAATALATASASAWN